MGVKSNNCRRHVVLLDTAGCFKLAIGLPTKDYKPGDKDSSRKQYLREYHKRPYVRERHNIQTRNWKKNNPEKVKESSKKWRIKNSQYNRRYKREWKKWLPIERKE